MSGNPIKQTVLSLLLTAAALSAQAFPGMPAGHPKIAHFNPDLFEVIAAEIAMHRQDPETAWQLLERTTERTQDPEVAALAWHAAVQTGNSKTAVKAARTWAKLAPDNEAPHQTLLADALENNRGEEFMAELARLYEKAKDKAAWTARITVMAARSGLNLKLAEVGLQPYWEKEAKSADVRLAVGLFRQTLRDGTGACRAAREAVALDPSSEKIVSAAADLCWPTDQQETRRMLEKFLSEQGNSASVRLIYSRVLARTGQLEHALSELKLAVRAAPDSPLIMLNAGQLAFDCKAFELAEEYLSRFVSLSEDADLSRHEVWLKLAAALHEEGRHDEEAGRLSRLTRGPLAPQARIREAGAMTESGRLDDARVLLTRAAENDQENRSLYLSAEAQLLIDAGRQEDALSILESALKASPNDASLMYDAAMTAENLGQHALAEKLLKTLIDQEPDHVQANNALGYIWVSNDKNLSEARRLLEHAYRLAPLDPFVLDSMGWLCFKEGRFDQAAEFTLTSLKKMFDVEVACHLIEILKAAGRDSDASSLYRELLKRSPRDERIPELGRRLGLQSPGSVK